MIEIKKPANLDGQKIIDYLESNNVLVIGFPYLDGEGKLFIEVKPGQEATAQSLMESFA